MSTYSSRKAADTWDNIKGALVGVAASRFQDFIGKAIPGFKEEYDKRQGESSGQPLNQPAISPSAESTLP